MHNLKNVIVSSDPTSHNGSLSCHIITHLTLAASRQIIKQLLYRSLSFTRIPAVLLNPICVKLSRDHPKTRLYYFPSSSLHRKLLTECCDPKRMFAVTKENSPMGKVLWYDGEFYHSHTVNNETYPLFVQVC